MTDLRIRELERATAQGDLLARDLLAVERLRLGLCGWCASRLWGGVICTRCKLGWAFPSPTGGLFSYWRANHDSFVDEYLNAYVNNVNAYFNVLLRYIEITKGEVPNE